MNFIFEWLYDRAQRVSKILFLPLEMFGSICKTPSNFGGNYRNYVIDKLTCQILENNPKLRCLA